MKQDKLNIRDFLSKVNKLKLFSIDTLYEVFGVSSKADKSLINDTLNKMIDRGYVMKRSDVYMPVFKRDKIVHGVIGYESPKKDMFEICKRFEVEPGFENEIVKEAEKRAALGTERKDGRKDYRDEILFTIDGEDAKDLDDAVSLKKDGVNYILTVHIADVSYYVEEKSLVDNEAYNRGTSIYLVDRVVPMLPRILSNGICSLNYGEDRFTLSCEVLLDKNGSIKKYDFFSGIINSKRRFTYKEVESLLDGEQSENKKDKKLKIILEEMKKLALILNKKRRSEGSIDFDIPETKIVCDKKSRPIEIKPVERLFAHKLIEEFMLTANKAAALFLEDKGIGVFRVHESPDSEKLANFIKIANRMGYHIPVFKSSTDVQKFVEETKDHPESYLLNTMLLRSMKQAYYHHENFGHFGLGFSHYTHFTSPIRRYPDLLVHRLIKKLKKIDNNSKEVLKEKYLSKAVVHASSQERVAVSMERAMKKRKAIHFMKDKLGQKFDGIISGVTEHGIYVALDDLGVEGMIVKNLLTGYNYDSEHSEFYYKDNRLRLGARIKVRLLSLNLKRELIDFNLIN